MQPSKDSVAQQLADSHYAVEPDIDLILQLIAPDDREADPAEPVKLLEVNQSTTSDGIRPVFFGPHPSSGIVFPSVIVEVTPSEYAQIRRQPSLLPNGWRIGREFPRPAIVAST